MSAPFGPLALDGCCILETDIPKGLMDAATVGGRYRDLQKAGRNFRTIKTAFLDIRPVFGCHRIG